MRAASCWSGADGGVACEETLVLWSWGWPGWGRTLLGTFWGTPLGLEKKERGMIEWIKH